MKATIDIPSAMVVVIVFMIGLFGMIYFGIGNITQVTTELVKPSYSQLSVVDSSYDLIRCLSTNGEIEAAALEQKKNGCRENSRLNFVEITDLSTGSSYASGSSSGSTEYTHYTNIKVDGESHLARVYVKKT